MVCLWSLMGQTFYRLSFLAISSLFSKLSHCKISMQILHTILYKFLKVLTRKISILMTRWRGLRGIMKVSDLGKLSYSRSVSLMFDHFPFCICCNFGIPTPCKISLHHWFFFVISSATRSVSPFLRVLSCCIRWGLRFHTFFGNI